jgi:hypothetical protein
MKIFFGLFIYFHLLCGSKEIILSSYYRTIEHQRESKHFCAFMLTFGYHYYIPYVVGLVADSAEFCVADIPGKCKL